MEKSSTSSNSNLVCKKILNAFSDFQKILPFSSHPRQDPSATRVSPPENPEKHSPLQLQITSAKAADTKPNYRTIKQEIPVLSDPPPPPPPPSGAQIKKTKEEGKIEQPKVKASAKDGDKFTDYIKEAKVKMRTTSDMGGETQIVHRSDATRKEDPKDKFSNYISRAGNRIRTTSSNIGFGKTTFAKRE